MRRFIVRLATLALITVPGCTDSLGLGTECQSEMARVRLEYGTADEVQSGARSQQWFYDSPRVYFEFDWSSGTCEVTGPVSYHRAPVEPIEL